MNTEKPIIKKRIRERKFTEKRNPYKNYLNAKWKWSDIFDEIDSVKHTKNFIKTVSIKYNINYNTLKYKYNYHKKHKSEIEKENRGGHNKKINDSQEKDLYLYIKKNYIDTDGILNNNIIKEIVKEKITDSTIVRSGVSKWWVSNFKKRWNLSTQKVKPSKIAVNIPSEDEQRLFINECREYKNKIKTKFFLTMMKQILTL